MERYIFSEEKRSVLESLRQPFAIYQFLGKKVVTLLLSDGFCDLFGYTNRDEAVYDMDNNMYMATHPDDVARIEEAAVRFAEDGGRYEVVYRTRTKRGSDYIVVHAVGEHVIMETGARIAQVWYTNESTYVADPEAPESEVTRNLDGALQEEGFIRAHSFDYLTGLPTMHYFFERCEEEKDVILARGGCPAMMYIDFSGMKFFNVKHGFAEGNKMLQSFARLMVRTFGYNDCCRIGADHFAAVAEEDGLNDRLSSIFSEFSGLYGGKTPPVHVGIYLFSVGDVSANSACERAKLACNKLKGSYSSGYSYYSVDLLEKAMLKQYIIENIDTAIREKWIQVYLQPIIRKDVKAPADNMRITRKDVKAPADAL